MVPSSRASKRRSYTLIVEDPTDDDPEGKTLTQIEYGNSYAGTI
jgi:hypothetical protein